ncbi:thioredoxin fold domain-containing protein [Dyadobacter sp. CY261]|uniref:thioredoxin family protein n=1 Tax=Dyadobacter sp. CY261 TaxID=2907203 RepID=UPI001F2EDC4C|nr:thioredoxin fold domain-containing protein [Dyadobacter sp. CY261]MCF0072548.1 thioredoxin fold domain-containing protein [Dyadobacter sp. CY261]
MKNLKNLGFAVVALMLAMSVAIAGEGDKKAGRDAEKGIQFTEASWSDILKKAKKENKIIFLDAYTTWCGPCKLLQKNVFTRDDVAKTFNGNFINVKIDMESGEGPALTKKYPIEGYPTLFFIDGKGKVVKQLLGYQQPEQLIKAAKSVQKGPAI